MENIILKKPDTKSWQEALAEFHSKNPDYGKVDSREDIVPPTTVITPFVIDDQSKN